MKKILLLVSMFFLMFGIVGCSIGGENVGNNKKTYTVSLHYGNVSSENITFNEGDYLYAQDLTLPSSLSTSYYLDGWYSDSNYSNIYSSSMISSDFSLYAKLGELKSLSNYTFGRGIDKETVLNYFKSKGNYISIDTAINMDMIIAYSYQQKGYGDCFYRIKSSEVWSSLNREREVLYFPQGDLFLVSFSTTEKWAIGSLNYAYQYTGSIEFTLGQKLNEATYNGTYDQACIDGYSYTYKAKYTAKFVFTPSKINPSSLRFGDFSTCKYTYGITDAMDYAAAQKHFDAKDSGQKCYEKLNACLNYLDEILQKINTSYKSIQ